MTHEITLLRHGESTGNLEKRIQGHSDFPLSEAGRQQVCVLANRWREDGVHFDHIITSTLTRAIETAQIIEQYIPAPIEQNAIWMERNFGSLEGEFLEDALAQDPNLDFYQPFVQIGGVGESQVELYNRALIAVQDLTHKPPGSYLVVSHGSMMNKVLYVILGITPQGSYNSPVFPLSNTAYFKVSFLSRSRQWYIHEYSNPYFVQRRDG